MAKKKLAPDVVSKPVQPKSYLIGSETYTEGDPLQIITPELGVIVPTRWYFAHYSKPGLVTFELGLISTPLPCIMNEGPDGYNAVISLSVSRFENVGGWPRCYYDNSLHMVYFCGCRQKHNDVMVWTDQVSFHKGVIQAHTIGRDKYNKPHNHPLVEGYEHLTPLQNPAKETVKEPKADRLGQIQLF